MQHRKRGMFMDGLLNRTNLHKYQEYSVRFIIDHPTAAILLDCGLGKTVITLTALNELLFDYFEMHKVLVICPLRVGNVWKNEVQKWSHIRNLKLSVAIGTETERLAAKCTVHRVRHYSSISAQIVSATVRLHRVYR
jgi:SNF2 family DNA or RNA helicase